MNYNDNNNNDKNDPFFVADHRYMAASYSSSYDTYKIDYTVLSVGVLTLGLLMIVETIRHKLDHAAKGRPFFHTVLEGVYTELATLGIVEFALRIMTEYYEDYDKAKKAVFADVHFLLFYTAIFNAIQSCILAAISTRISHKLWVTTETLELNHYVEIREEFEVTKNQLKNLRHNVRKSKQRRPILYNKKGNGRNSSTDSKDKQHGVEEKNATTTNNDTTYAEHAFEFSKQGFINIYQNIIDRIKYPQIKRRYNALLVQVRFHELRVSFLKSYNMPLKLKLSDYLKRCELDVLKKLVHVSPVAWLLLTGAINLLYYILSIAMYELQDPELVGLVLIYIFFGCIISFIILAWGTYNKMKTIYGSMMKDKHLWDVNNFNMDDDERIKLSRKQISMFWGSDPTFVISAIQFMQFGYAVALSSLIVFWKEINDGSVHMSFYVIVLIQCYTLFLIFIGQVIPRYTMCTSLAQMVNNQLLNETLANHKLQEEKRKQKEQLELLAYHNEMEDYLVIGNNNTHGQRNNNNNDNSISNSNNNNTSREDDTDVLATQEDNILPVIDKESKTAMIDVLVDKNINNNTTTSGTTTSKTRDVPLFTFNQSKSNEMFLPSVNEVMLDDSEQTQIPRNNLRKISKPHPHVRSEGYYSDADDVPYLDRSTIARPVSRYKNRLPIMQRIRVYVSSKNYIVFSNVFGTMIAFFMVAKRVELFLHLEGIIPDIFVSFDFPQSFTYWFLTSWFIAFLCISGLIIYLMSTQHSLLNQKDMQVLEAAWLDLILNSVCLIVFLVAEWKRCCHHDVDENIRLLADAATDEYKDKNDGQAYSPSTGYGDICSCPTFGTRSYGGLGTVEPYVSLVALRIFRHYAAKRIVTRIVAGKASNKDNNEDKILRNGVVNPFSIFDEKGHDNDNHGGHGQDDELVGTATQLWQAAISKHPDIVKEHGEFSEELLRAMLGVSLLKKVPRNSSHKAAYHLPTNDPPKSPTVQNLITTGKADQNNIKPKSLSTDEGQVLSDHALSDDETLELGRESSCKLETKLLELQSDFSSPYARLVRTMRRCDRKLLPIIDKWTAVDVVMTQFEMVYFDAVDIEDNTSKKNLVSTKGGKRRRLCDVAYGRRVVGHLQLSDIQYVHVDRYIPGSHTTTQDESPEAVVETAEFWKDPSNNTVSNPTRCIHDWEVVKQDILKIQTSHGRTVCLRFYSDLEEGLRHSNRLAQEDETFGDIFKNNALQWAKTIGRFCGPDQLHKQSLPHFGDDSCNELRDYLVLHHPKVDHRGREVHSPSVLQKPRLRRL